MKTKKCNLNKLEYHVIGEIISINNEKVRFRINFCSRKTLSVSKFPENIREFKKNDFFNAIILEKNNKTVKVLRIEKTHDFKTITE